MFEEFKFRYASRLFAIGAAVFVGIFSIWFVTYGLPILADLIHGKVKYPVPFSNLVNTDYQPFDSSTNVSDNIHTPDTSDIPAISDSRQTVTVMIGGDVMLDRKIRSMGEKNGYDSLFSSLTPLFKSADIVVVNLEGPITANPSKTLLPDGSYTKGMAFTFATSSVQALSNAGITAVSLANNHTDNFGTVGVTETKKWLTSVGLKWFGSPQNSISSALTMTVKGLNIAFVGYESFQSGIDNVLDEIERFSTEGYFVIVMPHWGDEYVSTSTALMRSRAQAFVSAGAKAVIGSHSHIIMDNETIGGVPIYYSIGNLLFDQYFSDAVIKGEILSLTISNGPAGPSLDGIKVYETRLDENRGVILK